MKEANRRWRIRGDDFKGFRRLWTGPFV